MRSMACPVFLAGSLAGFLAGSLAGPLAGSLGSLIAWPGLAIAQRLESPEVHPDRRVTFRLVAPQAETVRANIARADNGGVSLNQNAEGIWQGTSDPLPAEIHSYSFDVDGTTMIDPRNRWIKTWYTLASLFEIPGDPPLVTERQAVPHGTVHHHWYQSPVTDSQRPLIVYTPPGYDPESAASYPVLFLLHGFGDDQTAWTEVGRAALVADNLIAEDKIDELVIVMPDGHPVPRPYGRVPGDYGQANDAGMVRDIDEALLPWVGQHYHVASDPSGRAIAGLSMGGGHSIRTALATNDFAYVGAFSAAAPEDEALNELATNLGQFKQLARRFWIACGKDDFLLERNRAFVERLQAAGVPHTSVETAGAHNWDVWRDYLPRFLPQLFQ
jgi:enterochelin esterase family protein